MHSIRLLLRKTFDFECNLEYIFLAYSGSGLQTDLRRSVSKSSHITITFDLTVTDCKAAESYLVVKVLKADGTDDDWNDNDHQSIKLPPMQCDRSE